MKKERIDKLLVERRFAESIEKARSIVMSGVVLVDETRVEKPSQIFPPDAAIRLKDCARTGKFVGRGGLKLEKALREFHIQPNEYVCLDIGASTGGFTDCLLQNGAKKVFAVDAGTNQIVWKLRTDKRVEVRENTNARHLKPHDFADEFDLIVIDVSFISVTKIFPALSALLNADGRVVALVKPQFEVRKGEVGEGGIVRDEAAHERVVAEVNAAAAANNLIAASVVESPITGADGNKEFLVLYERSREN